MISLSDLAQFEKRYLSFEAATVAELRDWISMQHAGIQVQPHEGVEGGTVARLSRATVDDVALVNYRYSMALQGEFSEDYDAYFICLPISGSSKRLLPRHGEIIQLPDQMLIYRREAGHRNITSLDYVNMSLVMPARLLEQRLQSLLSVPLSEPLAFTPLVDIRSGAGRAVASLVNYLLTQFSSHPDPFSNALSNLSMKSYLSTVLLSSLRHNYSDALQGGSGVTTVPGTVKRAEEYMRELCAEAITIEQLAEVAGCSARSLHAAFRKFRGATPMAVLCDIRLEAAHGEMIRDTGTVMQIASKYGFSNAGRFARQYAQKYGQKPSETLLMGPPRTV
ncbi:MAG: AraC family transcriptional regulator [Pseudomonadota bacterium]